MEEDDCPTIWAELDGQGMPTRWGPLSAAIQGGKGGLLRFFEIFREATMMVLS